MLPPIMSSIITLIAALLAMAFFTLLERKLLGYIQTRKGPNKVSISGIPQPLADAMKLLTKEHNFPSMANTTLLIAAPSFSLFLALMLWSLYPTSNPTFFLASGALLFLCLSSLNVYTTLGAGWSSNSKYALLGALRSVAQTISYEISMLLILLSPLTLAFSLSLTHLPRNSPIPTATMFPLLLTSWCITLLAETNRTPFDFAEGESELVSGFNTEYSSGSFALIFMAEYTNILFMSLLTSTFFLLVFLPPMTNQLQSSACALTALAILWIRGTFPRMRYDNLMYLSWKTFLPLALASFVILLPFTQFC